jgi:23S rRNA (uracil1939-C5)-methyltransferase
MTTVALTTDAMATGGQAVGRDETGRVTFVDGALPGEQVVAEVTLEKKSFAKARLLEVRVAAPERRVPPCPHVARGCGGCGWQHAEVDAQRKYKHAILVDALQRLGGIADPDVRTGTPLPPTEFRTTIRAGVTQGRAGFRKAQSHEVLAVDSCLVAHPLLDELKAGRHAWYAEAVAGRPWRISATSFFQARPDGAEAIIDAIHDGLTGSEGRLVDLCCGVGLLGGALLARDPGRWSMLGVERHRPAVLDAQHNLADLDDVRIVRATMEKWRASAADVVVADPARAGLGKVGVATVVATGAELVALVSCDPASLGRDAGLLAQAGYRLAHTVPVELFPQTPHVEAVSIFRR